MSLRGFLLFVTCWLLCGRAAAAQELPAAATATVPAETSLSPAPRHEEGHESRFDEAVRLLVEGNVDEATAILRHIAATSGDAQRRSMAKSLLARVNRVQERRQDPALAQRRSEGRATLLATSTLLGMTFYGWALPDALDISDNRGQVGLYLLTAGTSFIVPFWLSADTPVSWGAANSGFWGGTRGIVHGFALANFLTGNNTIDDSAVALGLLTSAAELGGLTYYAQTAALSPGDAHALGIASDFGTLWGGTLGYRIGKAAEVGNSAQTRLHMGLALGGAVGGFALGHLYRERRQLSWGDAEFVRTSGVLGAFAGGVLADWIPWTTDNAANVPVLISAGSLGGLVLGDYLGAGEDFKVGQALLMDLGALAGGLVTMGVTYLASNSDDGTVYATAALVGSATGFGLLFRAFSNGTATQAAQWLENALPRQSRLSLAPWLGGNGERGLTIGGKF